MNIAHKDKIIPVFLKISPDSHEYKIDDIMKTINGLPIAGVIATNTTTARPDYLKSNHATETGGLSGKPLKETSTNLLHEIKKYLSPEKVLIGVGGITSGQDAIDKIHAGADAVQVYSGLIYHGRKLIMDILSEYDKRCWSA